MQKIAPAIFFALIAAFFINVVIYESDLGGNTLNLYHVLISLLFFLTFRFRPVFQFTADNLFFVTLATTSLLGWSLFGLSTRATLLPLIFMAFSVGNRWYELTSPAVRQKSYVYLFGLVVFVITMRNIVYFDSLGAIYGRSSAPTSAYLLASGGRNIEASQLGMLCTLLIGSVAFVPAVLVALLTSLLVMSRSGLLAVLFALLLWLIHGRVSRIKLYAGSLVLLAGMLACFVTIEGTYRISALERFDIRQDQSFAAEGQGRLAIWSASIDTLAKHPLGYGTGNGFRMLNESMGGHLRENNAHNIYIEYALDGGLQSMLLFGFVVVAILRCPSVVDLPCHRISLAYALLGLVQFTGYDAIGWFFIGASHAARLDQSVCVLRPTIKPT